MAASTDVRHPILPELYDRIDAFVQARLDEARKDLPDLGDAPPYRDADLALDALQYLATRAASTADLLRSGVHVHPDPAVRGARAEEAWETLRHIARRWHTHPDYSPDYAMTWRDHTASP
ncbi:hypothetical protein [Streptomyces javensis]|uniref:Uncharacterized protein n=1 Tax=Streptomyces javensis TaxID=114698 RepID=A0ABS0R2L6_9ACTN|nr:hypothetical protein [Streptomyces javensis]MBI0311628.1 hypothetical protein [Streptomyces javensis]